MGPAKDSGEMARLVRQRIAQLHETAPDSIGDLLGFEFVDCDAAKGAYTLRCQTAAWMRNPAGTLHGGMCAAIMDQAMGLIAYCVKPGEGTAPTIQLQLSYHRPLIPGEVVLVRVRVLSQTRSLINLSAEACAAASPERLCISAGAACFYKPCTP